MAKPVSPVSASSSLSTIAASSSRWNYKTVTVILALTVLGGFLYKVFCRYISASSPSTKESPPPSPLSREHLEYLNGPVSYQSQPLRKDPTVPFISGLSYQGKPCVNELSKPTFKKYASGIIQFDTATFTYIDTFGDVRKGEACNIQCMDHTGAVFFKTYAALAGDDKLGFFIANLPFGKDISVKFGTTEKNTKEIKLNISKPVGLYTIRENDADQGLNYKSASLNAPKVLSPRLTQNLISLATPFAFSLDSDGVMYSGIPIENENRHLAISSMEERSVMYVLLVSNNSALSVEEQAIALPVIIDGDDVASFSLPLLESLWITQYEYATGKKRPDGDLQLHLGGHQQIVCPETSSM